MSMATGEYERFGLYGSGGNNVGVSAVYVMAALLEPAPAQAINGTDGFVVWSENDRLAFGNLVELETGIKFIEPAPDPLVDGGDVARLHRALARFHASLPLSEAERHWLCDPLIGDRQFKRSWDIHHPETLLGVAEEVTSAGIRQVIQGHEVVRRLAAWRRETDEFAHQGTLDEAREALGTIATTLVIDANWPREHADLRAQLRDGE